MSNSFELEFMRVSASLVRSNRRVEFLEDEVRRTHKDLISARKSLADIEGRARHYQLLYEMALKGEPAAGLRLVEPVASVRP